MAFSDLGKILEVVEEVLDVVPLIRKGATKLSEQAIVDSRIHDLRHKIFKLKQMEEFK